MAPSLGLGAIRSGKGRDYSHSGKDMTDSITFQHRTHSLLPQAFHDVPTDSISADIAEESQADIVLKLKLVRDRAQSHLLVNARRQGVLDSLQQQIANSSKEAEKNGFCTPNKALDSLSEELQDVSQRSIYSMHDLSKAVDQLTNHVEFDTSALSTDESHREFFDRLAEAMKDLDKNWLSNYENALAKYIDFFSEFNTIMADLQKYIKASSDGQKVEIDFTNVGRGLLALKLKYSRTDNALASFPTEAEAKKFIDDLGLSGLSIVRSPDDGQYKVMIDMSPLNSLIDSMGSPLGKVNWDMARYNAWLSGKDSYTEQLQHVSKVLGEKYSRNLQLLDTLIKVLSSSIDSMGEADRTFVNNF
jgi:type III secretion system IpaD/SipD/SspD family effector